MTLRCGFAVPIASLVVASAVVAAVGSQEDASVALARERMRLMNQMACAGRSDEQRARRFYAPSCVPDEPGCPEYYPRLVVVDRDLYILLRRDGLTLDCEPRIGSALRVGASRTYWDPLLASARSGRPSHAPSALAKERAMTLDAINAVVAFAGRTGDTIDLVESCSGNADRFAVFSIGSQGGRVAFPGSGVVEPLVVDASLFQDCVEDGLVDDVWALSEDGHTILGIGTRGVATKRLGRYWIRADSRDRGPMNVEDGPPGWLAASDPAGTARLRGDPDHIAALMVAGRDTWHERYGILSDPQVWGVKR